MTKLQLLGAAAFHSQQLCWIMFTVEFSLRRLEIMPQGVIISSSGVIL